MVAVDLTSFAKVLGGAKRLEGSGANRPTNVSRIVGTAVSDSADGKVLVDLDAQVFSGDGSQYVEIDTSDNVREGDRVYVDMVGADGRGKSLMISGAPGSGDRQQEEIGEAATTATRYVTETTDNGIMVHPEDDPTTGWRIADALELLRSGASAFKAWLDNGIAKLRIGEETGANMVLDPDGIGFFNGLSRFAELAVNAAGMVSLSAKNLSDSGYWADVRAYEQDGSAHTAIAAGYNDGGSTIHPAYVSAEGGPTSSLVTIAGEQVTVLPDGGITSIHNASADNLAAMIACRAYLAGGDVTIPANGGASFTWTWQGANIVGGGSNAASFPDANYVVSIGKSWNGVVSGFTHVDFMVTGKTKSSVTVYGWNDNAYAVTIHVTCIGFNSRYGTIA